MKQVFPSSQQSAMNPTPVSDVKRASYFPAPYGKVENAGRPEGYIVKERVLTEIPCDRFDVAHPDSTIVGTTIPPMVKGQSLPPGMDPVLWTECLLDVTTKKQIYSFPGFPAPLLQPAPEGYYRIGPSLIDTAGVGVFAERNFHAGEVIFSERPLMVTPSSIGCCTRISVPEHFTREQYAQALFYEHEKILQAMFDRMFPEYQQAFMSLANAHTEDGSGPILGRIRTNCVHFGGIWFRGAAEEAPSQLRRYAAVCRDLSRINHSCRPNVTYSSDLASFSFSVVAAQNINKGDELFITYCKLLEPAASRAAQLIRYSISRCQCLACSNSTASDARRKKIVEGFKKHPDSDMMAYSTQGLPASKARYFDGWAKEQITLLEEEGLQHVYDFRYEACIRLRQLAIRGKMNVKPRDFEEIETLGRKLGQLGVKE